MQRDYPLLLLKIAIVLLLHVLMIGLVSLATGTPPLYTLPAGLSHSLARSL